VKLKGLLRWIIAFIILAAGFNPLVSVWARPAIQTDVNGQAAQNLLDEMLPEERVGQLFLVTFYGPEAAPGTPQAQQIYDLIVQYHVGGVMLKRENDNFVAPDQTIPVLMSLTDQLQRNEYSASLSDQVIPGTEINFRPVFIPLFIGLSQDGNGYPYDQLLSGVTQLPNQMALGATWQPDLARQAGEVMGKELNILGINLFLGPSLDVLETRTSGAESDFATTSFGGDPYWVGEMGRAYITGLHQGSNNELAVVGKHFPGFGGSDRLPEEEVATVRKTLEQLKQFELYPFFATTGYAPSQDATLDGLLAAHIRYQGFQENFRQTTKPISFDSQAFSKLMSLPALDTWRTSGGLMISDSLGSRAVRRFYDPTGQTFNGRVVALDAFLAGNDMLYLDDFVSTNDPDSYTSITRTISFFVQKYKEDTAFAQRVDQSVLRILKLKLHLYGNQFFLNKVRPDINLKNQLGQGYNLSFQIAREAATLISPQISELGVEIPLLREQVVFITDTRLFQQCQNCIQQNVITVDALEQAINRLYSPAAGAQVQPRDLSSYSYQDLYNMLQSGVGETEIEAAIRQAKWIIFVALNADSSIPSSTSLQRFLIERPDLYTGKHMVVFSLGAPFNLDATDIAKLSAYYGLYSHSKEFIEVAARLLFQEIQPSGNLPVSVVGIGYDINRITFPDPDQVIPLILENQPELPQQTTPTPEAASPLLTFRVGEVLDVRAGSIVDHNGHIVPDGTIVRFILTQGGELGINRQVEVSTKQGIARATLRIDIPGNLQIRAESEDAKQSQVIQIIVPVENITETPQSSPTITNTTTPEPSPSASPSPTPQPTPTTIIEEPARAGLADWLTSLVTVAVLGTLSYFFSSRTSQLRWRVRCSLLTLIGGILAYTYLALALPGTTNMLENGHVWSAAIVAALGACLGWLTSLIWKRL